MLRPGSLGIKGQWSYAHGLQSTLFFLPHTLNQFLSLLEYHTALHLGVGLPRATGARNASSAANTRGGDQISLHASVPEASMVRFTPLRGGYGRRRDVHLGLEQDRMSRKGITRFGTSVLKHTLLLHHKLRANAEVSHRLTKPCTVSLRCSPNHDVKLRQIASTIAPMIVYERSSLHTPFDSRSTQLSGVGHFPLRPF